MIKSIEAKGKVLKDSTLCPAGTVTAAGILNSEGYTRLDFPLTDGTHLDLLKVGSIDIVAINSGWESPKEVAKVVGVTAASVFGAGILTDALLNVTEVEAAWKAISIAIENNDAAKMVEAMKYLSEVMPTAAETSAATVVDVYSVAGPAIYGYATLSARTTRLVITTKNDKILKVDFPEYFATFLVGLYNTVGGGDQ